MYFNQFVKVIPQTNEPSGLPLLRFLPVVLTESIRKTPRTKTPTPKHVVGLVVSGTVSRSLRRRVGCRKIKGVKVWELSVLCTIFCVQRQRGNTFFGYQKCTRESCSTSTLFRIHLHSHLQSTPGKISFSNVRISLQKTLLNLPH